MVKGNNYFNKN